jgi:hypothetical protein
LESLRCISWRETLHAFAIHFIRRHDVVRAACCNCIAKEGNIRSMHPFVFLGSCRHLVIDASFAKKKN